MQYLRGHEKDFEAWANLTGDSSWNYDNVLPHFKAIEDFHGEYENRMCNMYIFLFKKRLTKILLRRNTWQRRSPYCTTTTLSWNGGIFCQGWS